MIVALVAILVIVALGFIMLRVIPGSDDTGSTIDVDLGDTGGGETDGSYE